VGGDASKPADHVGRVAAEHAAVGVYLVEHHVREVAEELGPRVVVGQDAEVEHVGISQDDLGLALDTPALGDGRVAVVGCRGEGLTGSEV